MLKVGKEFHRNIEYAKELGEIYWFFSGKAQNLSFDNLLRSQILHAVSAFDKLIHDLICIGMADMFRGRRPDTSKYLNESFSMRECRKFFSNTAFLSAIGPEEAVSLEDRAVCFENVIRQKMHRYTFQNWDQVMDGLSYIWDEKHKAQKIAENIGLSLAELKKMHALVIARRNSIAHEADVERSSQQKNDITYEDALNSVNHLSVVGDCIFKLVQS